MGTEPDMRKLTRLKFSPNNIARICALLLHRAQDSVHPQKLPPVGTACRAGREALGGQYEECRKKSYADRNIRK